MIQYRKTVRYPVMDLSITGIRLFCDTCKRYTDHTSTSSSSLTGSRECKWHSEYPRKVGLSQAKRDAVAAIIIPVYSARDEEKPSSGHANTIIGDGKRRSTIPTRIIRREPKPESNVRCIGCGDHVATQWCYTGSMLRGMTHATVEGRGKLLGSSVVPSHSNVGFFNRVKGWICSDCSSDYRTILNETTGIKHPVVQVDARPGFLGTTAAGANEKVQSDIYYTREDTPNPEAYRKFTRLNRGK